MSNLKIYLDGQFVDEKDAKISVFDHGALYGDGVFEGIRAYGGSVFKLKDHIDRIFSAAKAIMLDIPMTKEELSQVVIDTCKINNFDDCYIRLVISRGKGDLGLSPTKCTTPTIFCIATGISLYSKEAYEKGLKVITASQRRNKATIIDPQIKSLNYLNNILAKIEANRAGCDEAIMLTEDGIVAECTGDNVFIIKDGVIYTTPVYVGTLDGITRRSIIDICHKNGLDIREQEFTLFNLYNADEAFLTGTAAECIALTQADGRTIGNGVAGPITLKLFELFQDYVKENGTKIQ